MLPVTVIMVLTLVLVAIGAFYAWRMYGADVVPEVAPKGSPLTRRRPPSTSTRTPSTRACSCAPAST